MSEEHREPVDPITLAVVSGALSAAVSEMASVIERTARSPVVALSHDYSNALYTVANGIPEMVVQGQDQPCHLGGMLRSVKTVANQFAEDLVPGDVIIANDPSANGTHLLDVDLIQPIFFDEHLVAWACSRAHQVDIGGPIPGGYNPHAEDVYAEGLRIPAIKLVQAGQVRDDVWSLILANVRSSHLVRGDMGAQLSANRVAERRIHDLFARYGAEIVQASMTEMLDRAERMIRAEISNMPDGSCRGVQWIQDDGHGAPDYPIACTIDVQGSEMRIALESPPAVQSYRNSYGGLTIGAVYYAVISGLTPGLPINEGLYRPIEVDLGPPGTMLNAVHPAACATSTADVWIVVWDAVCDAMSKIVPHRACAGWQRAAILQVAGTDPRFGEHYSSLLHVALMGGAGAVCGLDGGGLWGLANTGGASTTGDVELLEFRLPLHFTQHELRCDSACPGRWRGAVGAIVEFEPVGHEAQLTYVGDGTRFPPPSRLGGGSVHDAEQRTHQKYILHDDGTREIVPMHSVSRVSPADRVLALIPGGGAVGDPLERDPASVARDVRSGLVSIELAREEYGVAVDPELFLVDASATSVLRVE